MEELSKGDLVWKVFFSNHVDFLRENSHLIFSDYLLGWEKLGYDETVLPTLDEINHRLLGSTPFQFTRVAGYLAPWDFFALLRTYRFPLASGMRSLEQLDYAPQPDFLHDIVGHGPLLFSRELMDLNLAFAAKVATIEPEALDREKYRLDVQTSNILFAGLSQENSDLFENIMDEKRQVAESIHRTPTALTRLLRLYAWTLELGLCGGSGKEKIYGAGLLSSRHEMNAIFAGMVEIVPLDESVFDHEIEFSDLQRVIYRVKSFDQIANFL